MHQGRAVFCPDARAVSMHPSSDCYETVFAYYQSSAIMRAVILNICRLSSATRRD